MAVRQGRKEHSPPDVLSQVRRNLINPEGPLHITVALAHRQTPEGGRSQVPTVLVVSPITENRERLQQALHGIHWKIQGVQTYRETLAVLRREWPHVIICECPLADGSWKDLLSLVAPLLDAPLLIVTSRSADDYLWSEVLNMGGHDVLVQ